MNRRQFTLAIRILSGIYAGTSTVLAAINGHWDVAYWALIVTIYLFLHSIHRCPTPPEPDPTDRGAQYVNFNGGPVDGGTYTIPGTDRDLHHATLHLAGTDYHVTTVHHTCYNAEATP
ncbi:hypothetical protein GCM10009592_28430 [Brachybacterium rhamnosum]|uniref:Uncharacterized protein n=1 Tax=Brachybacterium rhamnosum TaxID=173361 RepID=A0ABW4Q094_9MICO